MFNTCPVKLCTLLAISFPFESEFFSAHAFEYCQTKVKLELLGLVSKPFHLQHH